MAVDDQLSDEIANFLSERVAEREWPEARIEDGLRGDVVSSDDLVTGSSVGARTWQDTVIFFANGVKICAKFAHDSLNTAKTSMNLKRQRSPLAACFFGDFCFFPLLLSYDKTSTTPQNV